MKTVIFERGDSVYLVSPVAPLEVSDGDVEELAFAQDVKRLAPNENIGWLRGQYVEGDRPNDNGQMWRSDELEIASLTPMLMPVTVMHDPRTAVGMIADVKLLTPAADQVPRARIDTTLGVWRHRFGDVWEEALANYEDGTLMQSQECRPPYYDCATCGASFPKLPGGAERANWCAHLKGEGGENSARILRNVTFTGTGLIFGTRGHRGALDSAHLDVFQDEVAAFHQEAHSSSPKQRRTRPMDTIEIKRDEYDSLKAKAAQTDDLTAKVAQLEETAAKVTELTAQVETTETAKVAAEAERDELKTKVENFEEQSRAATLSKDRLGKLGTGFTGKLGDFTRGRLEEQAGALSDEDWDARLQELEETAGVKRDEGGTEEEENSGDEVSRQEASRGGATPPGGENGGSATPTPAQRRSVVAGLIKTPAGKAD